MAERSTPDCRRCIAVVCRSVWGEIRRFASEGQRVVAVAMAVRSRLSTPERESARPRPLGKSGAWGPPSTRGSHSLSRFTEWLPRVEGGPQAREPFLEPLHGALPEWHG